MPTSNAIPSSAPVRARSTMTSRSPVPAAIFRPFAPPDAPFLGANRAPGKPCRQAPPRQGATIR